MDLRMLGVEFLLSEVLLTFTVHYMIYWIWLVFVANLTSKVCKLSLLQMAMESVVTWGCQMGIFWATPTSPAICPLMHTRNSAWWRGWERKGDEKVEREEKKTALVAKWVHLLITMAVAVFPLVVGTHETFRSPRGLLKLQRLAFLSPLAQLGSSGAWGQKEKGPT